MKTGKLEPYGDVNLNISSSLYLIGSNQHRHDEDDIDNVAVAKQYLDSTTPFNSVDVVNRTGYLNNYLKSGLYNISENSKWYHLIHMKHYNNDGWAAQIKYPFENDVTLHNTLYIRRSNGNIWRDWVELSPISYVDQEILNLDTILRTYIDDGLALKSNIGHSHVMADITNLTTLPHTHFIDDVTDPIGTTTGNLSIERLKPPAPPEGSKLLRSTDGVITWDLYPDIPVFPTQYVETVGTKDLQGIHVDNGDPKNPKIIFSSCLPEHINKVPTLKPSAVTTENPNGVAVEWQSIARFDMPIKNINYNITSHYWSVSGEDLTPNGPLNPIDDNDNCFNNVLNAGGTAAGNAKLYVHIFDETDEDLSHDKYINIKIAENTSDPIIRLLIDIGRLGLTEHTKLDKPLKYHISFNNNALSNAKINKEKIEIWVTDSDNSITESQGFSAIVNKRKAVEQAWAPGVIQSKWYLDYDSITPLPGANVMPTNKAIKISINTWDLMELPADAKIVKKKLGGMIYSTAQITLPGHVILSGEASLKARGVVAKVYVSASCTNDTFESYPFMTSWPKLPFEKFLSLPDDATGGGAVAPITGTWYANDFKEYSMIYKGLMEDYYKGTFLDLILIPYSTGPDERNLKCLLYTNHDTWKLADTGTIYIDTLNSFGLLK